MRHFRAVVAKQLTIVKVKVHFSTGSKKVRGEELFSKYVQLSNFLYGATFPPLNVARWRYFSCKNAAVVRWRNDLKGGARRGGAG